MKMLVLAGGFGTRLQSALAGVPKALAPIGDVPFLHLQIQNWVDQGLSSFVFLLHHQADLIIDFLRGEQEGLLKNCDVQWLCEPEPMGTGGALAYAVKQLQLTDNFLATNADTWLGTGIMEVCQAGAPSIAIVNTRDAGRFGSVRINDENRIVAFKEKSREQNAGWINAGLFCLNSDMFGDWNHLPCSLEQDYFPRLVAQKKLLAVPLETDFIDIGIPNDYFRFCRWIETGRGDFYCN